MLTHGYGKEQARVKMHKLFHNYDGTLPKIAGFTDDSYKNDACPSLFNPEKNLKLWVEYKNPARRESYGARYQLCAYNPETDSYKELLLTEKLIEVRKYIKSYTTTTTTGV